MNQPLFSIIIPVYNVEPYLHRTIDSILNQQCNDYELILVDDGSTDNSPLICDKYASLHSNIKVIHQKNQGPSSARNTGIRSSLGKYVLFNDADDFLTPTALNDYARYCSIYDCQLFVSFYQIIENDSIRTLSFDTEFKILSLSDGLLFMEQCTLGGWPWNKLYKLSIIKEHNLFFKESIRLHEDRLFNIRYYKYVKSICIIPAITYNYVIYAGSLSHANTSVSNIKQRIETLNIYISEAEKLEISKIAFLTQLRVYMNGLCEIRDVMSYNKYITHYDTSFRLKSFYYRIKSKISYFSLFYYLKLTHQI